LAKFTTDLIVKKVGKMTWEVYEPLIYERSVDDVITVPIGFVSDIASIPKPLWSILPPNGRYAKAAFLHDFLYFSKKRSRKECDFIFLEAMQVLGVSWLKRRIMFAAVRVFGGFARK